MVEVIQDDREAAAAVVEWHNHAASQWEVTAEAATLQFFVDSAPASMRAGAFDEHDLVQAFALHRRLNSHSAAEGLREAAVTSAVAQCFSGMPERMAHSPVRCGDHHLGTLWSVSGEIARAVLALLTPPSDAGSTTRSGGEVATPPSPGNVPATGSVFRDHPRVGFKGLSALATTPSPDASPDSACTASPDHADILETVENAADNWQQQGYKSALAEVRDMANVGRALMEALPEGYSYNNCPSEIVADLMNERDDAHAADASPDSGEIGA